MTQSDSPDFEFDISDLEVGGDAASASKRGESLADAGEESVAREVREPAGFDESASATQEGEEDDDAELSGFSIDELPDAFSPEAEAGVEQPQVAPSEVGIEDQSPVAEASAPAESGLDEVNRVPQGEAKSSRALGEDDLGADVFAEIEDDSGSVSFSDVIDSLMDEVEEFEAGGLVDLDEDSILIDEEGDELFRMQDPDDSLGRSVDPNAEDEPVPAAAAPAFPSPPADFEIPADPEPVSESVAEPLTAQSEAVLSPEMGQAAGQPGPTAHRHAPATGAAQAASSAQPEVSAPSQVPVESSKEPESDSQAADVSAPPASADRSNEGDPELDDITAEDEEVPQDDASGVEPGLDDDARAPAEGHEHVLFSADEEDLEPAASVDESEASEAVELEAAEEGEDRHEEAPDVEALVGDGSDAVEHESADAFESSFSGAAELAEEEPLANEGDLAELVGAIPEEEDAFDEEGAEEVESGLEEILDGLEGDEEVVPLPTESEMVADSESEVGAEEEIETEVEEEAIELSSAQEGDEPVESESESLEDATEPATPAAEESPSLQVLEEGEFEIEDDEEIVAMPVPEIPGLVEVEEEEGEAVEEMEPAAAASAPPPSAEELLMRAGSLLNADHEKPLEGANRVLQEIDTDDDDEVVAMPSPEAMIEEAASEDDDDEVVALPDPASLFAESAEAPAVIEDEEEEKPPVSGNVADRAGDLPPPPPAPIEIVDEEPPEEDIRAEVPEEELPEDSLEESVASSSESEGGEALEDPFSGEISLDDFSEDLGDLEASAEDGDDADSDALEGEGERDEQAEPRQAPAVAEVVEMPKPSLLWRVTHSMALAAGFALVGLASVLAVWKQQILEYYEGRDIDGSALIHEIETVSTHALESFDESGLYRMQWVDSEVRRVSKNEIRLHALIGAQLRENLYQPVLESELGKKFDYSEEPLMSSLSYAHQNFPEEIGYFPDKPWERLYRLSAAKGEVLSLRVTYGLTRPEEHGDWELSRVKVSGYKGDLKWPEGEVAYAFGEHAYDIDSLEFAKLFSEYKSQSNEYIARIDGRKVEVEDGRLALKRENDRQRERVRMALSEGAYFSGVAILGEDAAQSEDVQLVITEVRDEGSFVKGVVRMNGAPQEQSKHFVGSLKFETTLSGKEQGFLSMTTVSMDAPQTEMEEATFFHANTVSRMRLRADGFRLEGDAPDLSFRLTRNL